MREIIKVNADTHMSLGGVEVDLEVSFSRAGMTESQIGEVTKLLKEAAKIITGANIEDATKKTIDILSKGGNFNDLVNNIKEGGDVKSVIDDLISKLKARG